MPASCSKAGLALLALALTACQAPMSPGGLAHTHFELGEQPPLASVPDAPVQPQAAPASPASAPQAPVVAATGGGGSAPTLAQAPLGGSVWLLPSGQRMAAGTGAAVPVPDGLAGALSLLAPGWVPATLVLPAGSQGLVTHPTAIALPADPSQTATIDGALATPEAGIAVQYLSRGRTLFAGAYTDGSGHFHFDVPVDAAEDGVVVAREANAYPRLAIAPASLSPGATTSVAPITLQAPQSQPLAAWHVLGTSDPAPATNPLGVPADMALTGGVLQLAESAGGEAWRLNLLALPSAALPVYDLPGFTQVHSFRADAADGSKTSITSGAPGQVAPFLAAPDLSALSTQMHTGVNLSWPAVPGARLYTVRLVREEQMNPPLWEAVTPQPRIALPAGLTLSGALRLQVAAWDSPDLTIYSVAEARALRVPDEPPGASGRVSFAWHSCVGP